MGRASCSLTCVRSIETPTGTWCSTVVPRAFLAVGFLCERAEASVNEFARPVGLGAVPGDGPQRSSREEEASFVRRVSGVSA